MSYRNKTEKQFREAIESNNLSQVKEWISFATSQNWILWGAKSLSWACKTENAEIIQEIIQWRIEKFGVSKELLEDIITSHSVKSLNIAASILDKHLENNELLSWASELYNCSLKLYKVLLNRYAPSHNEMNGLFRVCLLSENVKVASYLCDKICFGEIEQERSDLFSSFQLCVQLEIGKKTGQKLLSVLGSLSSKEAKIISSHGRLYKSDFLEDVLDRCVPETDFKNFLFVAAYRKENKDILHKILQRMPDTSLVVSFFKNRLDTSAEDLLQLCIDEHNALKYKKKLTDELSEMKQESAHPTPKRKI